MVCLNCTDFKFSLYKMMVKIVNFLSGLMKLKNYVIFINNGAGHGRNARLMEKPKNSGGEEVWRAMLMDKVDCVGSELRLIKILT